MECVIMCFHEELANQKQLEQNVFFSSAAHNRFYFY